jgi:phosphoribosylanthranilate isomerase
MDSRWPGTDGAGPVLVKVCGIRSVADAEMCVTEGVDAIGLNFWSGSSREVEVEEAARIVEAVGGRIAVVGLFVDAGEAEIVDLRERVGFDWVQLHGDEPPELVRALGPQAYKALRVRDEHVSEEAERFGGALVLLDAWVAGQKGGTGERFDWRLARSVASRRPVVLAGGLDADNVGEAVRQVGPRAVDVASGVESSVGEKDRQKVAAFVAAARAAV